MLEKKVVCNHYICICLSDVGRVLPPIVMYLDLTSIYICIICY